MTPNYIIVDLDNCIADDAWRIPRINWQKSDPMERYHDYHSLSGFDTLHNEDILITPRHERIVVLTARPVAYRAVTEEWLRRNEVSHWHLLMRNNHDHRSSLDLKRAMLVWLQELYGVPLRSVVAAYDDRTDIVEMFREHGLPAQVRSIHDTCAYTPPAVKEAA